MKEIVFKINEPLKTADIIVVFDSSGISRPTSDSERITTMFKHGNLIISAWHESELIGISRALTDFAYCCYLSDLAVKKAYQNQGIGRKLIEMTKEALGDGVMLLLLSAPNAMDYYPKLGFQDVNNGFIIKRKK